MVDDLQSSTPLIALEPVVIDTETTGLDVAQDRIIQIAALRVAAGVVDSEKVFDGLINPGVEIPISATGIHGILTEDIAQAEDFGGVVDSFLDFTGESLVVGHHVAFDVAILRREFSLSHREWPAFQTLDTMLLARIVNPFLPNYSLDVVAAWLGVKIQNRHTALGDATATGQIYLALLPRLREIGVRTYGEAYRASLSASQKIKSQAGMSAAAMSGIADADIDALPSVQRIDSFPFKYRVEDVMSPPPLVVSKQTTAGQLAETLSNQNKSAAFIDLSGDRECLGIVTERDLMRLLIKEPGGEFTEVGQIAKTPLQTIEKSAFIFKALGQMHNAAIRHLGVTDDRDVVVGAITSGDLLRQRAEDALNMGVTLDQAGSVESLAKIWGRLPTVARSLLNEDVAVTHIAAVISDQLATLTRRAAELAEQQMRERGHGAPPTKYAVLLLGSGGRGETLLAPDQDNALVYEDGNENAETWFAEFGQIMSETLDVVGVPYCNGGVMASNAQWRHSVSNWKKTVRDWLGRAEWEDLCYVDIFYDFSFVFGDHTLARDLREYAYALSGKAPGFIRQLSALATMYDPPINIFGILKTENGRADLKHGGALPIVGGARVLALNYGISESATRRRLRGARKLGIADSDDLEAVEEAHSILLRAILEQQLIDLETGVEPSNSVDVKRLSKRKRLAIKGALKRIEIIKTVVGDPMAFG